MNPFGDSFDVFGIGAWSGPSAEAVAFAKEKNGEIEYGLTRFGTMGMWVTYGNIVDTDPFERISFYDETRGGVLMEKTVVEMAMHFGFLPISRNGGIYTQNNGGSTNPDFVYDNNNTLGLGLSILEPGLGAALDAVVANPGLYTNGAKILGAVGGSTVIGANVGLTGYTLYKEKQRGELNTHSYVNAVVTGVSAAATGIGLAIAGGAIVVTSPVWGTGLLIGGAVLGVGYGIAQVAGIDEWIDSNWGMKKK